MKIPSAILHRLFRDIPHEVTSLLNVLYAIYPDKLIGEALRFIDEATGTDTEKAKTVSGKLVKLGLSSSGANLLIEILIALGKFIGANNSGDNAVIKALIGQLDTDTAKLNQAIKENK